MKNHNNLKQNKYSKHKLMNLEKEFLLSELQSLIRMEEENKHQESLLPIQVIILLLKRQNSLSFLKNKSKGKLKRTNKKIRRRNKRKRNN